MPAQAASPGEKSEKFFDRYTDIDEKLDRLNKFLARLDAAPEPELDGRFDELLALIKSQHEKDYDIFYLTYPDDGTRTTFAVGTTILDFENGTIKPPTGSVTKMSTDLKKQSKRSGHKDVMRSFAINCDKDVVVQLDENNKSPVRANVWGKMTHQMYTKARVTVTAATTGYVHACTNPEAIHEQIGEATVAVGKQTIEHIDSDKDTHFTGAIVQNAIETENLTGLSDSKLTITGISIQADEALNYRLWLFGTDGHADADLDDDEFVEFVSLDLSTNGGQIAGAGQYYYALTGLSIEYEDEDATKELHVALQNLSAAAKTAGAAGEVKMKIFYKPRL